MPTKLLEGNGERKTRVLSESSAAAWIVPRNGKQSGSIFVLRTTNLIGADARTCNIVLDEEHVSGRHAELLFQRDRWILKDLGSTNGTRVGTMTVPRDQRFEGLQDGDVITLGKLEVTFKCA